jgi:hypothetical protein
VNLFVVGTEKQGMDGSYRDSPEGLVDLLNGEALLLEEGSPVDDRGAPDLGVGEEFDGVLEVVLPQRLRRGLKHQLLVPDSFTIWCCSWIRGKHRIRHQERRGESKQDSIFQPIQCSYKILERN